MVDFPDYIARAAEAGLKRALGRSRIVYIQGGRQVGKSTLAQRLSPAHVTFDNLATREYAERDPHGFVRSLAHGTVIDEVQIVPEIFSALKLEVDTNPTPGRYILTGSANFLTLPKVSESLAGRVELFTLFPLAQVELEGAQKNFIDLLFDPWSDVIAASEPFERTIERIVRGGYPRVQLAATQEERDAWFTSYVATLLQRDIREISKISDIVGMETLLRLTAARTAMLLNESSVASEALMLRKTVTRYLELLESIFLTWRQPAFAKEQGRRVTKTSKVHVADTGLGTYFCNLSVERLAGNHSLVGNLLETFIVNELRAQASWSASKPRIFHHRTYEGDEVDAVFEQRDGKITAVEIKATATPRSKDIRPLQKFAEETGDAFVRGVLLYSGSEIMQIGNNLWAVPLATLWA